VVQLYYVDIIGPVWMVAILSSFSYPISRQINEEMEYPEETRT